MFSANGKPNLRNAYLGNFHSKDIPAGEETTANMFTPFPSHTSSRIAWAEQRLSQQRLDSPISWEGAKCFSLREQAVVLIPFPSTFCWQTNVVPETWALRSPVWRRCLWLTFCYACCWLVPVYISIVFCLAVGKWCTCPLSPELSSHHDLLT